MPYSPISYRSDKISELGIMTGQKIEKTYQNCKFKLIPNANCHIQINHKDEYYCTIQTPMTITSTCTNSTVEITTLNQNEILKIPENCQISTMHQTD